MAADDRIRVLLLLPSLHGGGAERVATLLLEHADRTRFDVRMGLLRRDGPYLEDVDPALVEAPTIGERFLDFEQGNDKTYRPLSLLAGAAFAPANVVAMMRRFRPHVVMSFRKGMAMITWAAVTLYGRRRVKWIVREGNNTFAVIDDELASEAARSVVRRLTSRCYSSADRLLTISHEMGEGLVRDLPVPRDNVTTVHNAVDLEHVRRRAAEDADVPEDEPFLVAVGRLHRQKGFDVLLDAFARSAARQTRRLVILGRGDEEHALRAQADRLGIGDRISLPGWVDNPWAWMKRADAFVLSSRWEGFGNVIIEAMACGLPALVTDCDFGPKEIVQDGDSGLIVPTDRADALTEAMDRLAADRSLRNRLAEGAVRRAGEFDVPVIVDRYQTVFSEVAGGASAVAEGLGNAPV